jgi:hypothetical protein
MHCHSVAHSGLFDKYAQCWLHAWQDIIHLGCFHVLTRQVLLAAMRVLLG